VKPIEEAAVRAALRRVWPDPLTVDKVQVRALGGGVVARTFLAVGGGRSHVLRLPIASSVAALDLATEVRALRTAAAADLAPRVIAVDIEAGLLLTDYCILPLNSEELRQPVIVTALVRSLRALHALQVELPTYSVERFARQYVGTLAASTTGALTSQEHAWAGELTRLGRHFDASYSPTAFCHTDLGASNILVNGAFGGAAARFIDFEYAGRGAPLLDLASLAGMNGFAAAQRRQLLDEYYGTAPAAPTMRDLGNAIRMGTLLAYFWARVAEQRLTDANALTDLVASLGATLRQG
jgi:aminoglycoside phosphotransferase (APT) family kinase protein